MKSLPLVIFLGALLASTPTVSAQTGGTGSGSPKTVGCSGCAQQSAVPAKIVASPDEVNNLPKGQIENTLPIGILIVLGCEKCAQQAVGWALQQGSSFEDIERALRTVSLVQRLECFKQQFGPDVANRIEKPLAAARQALQKAMDGAAQRD